jgi:putative cardiolipin synthase
VNSSRIGERFFRMSTVLGGIRARAQASRIGAASTTAVAVATAALVVGCAAVRHDAPRPVSHAIDNPQQTELARRFATQLPSEPGMSGFRLLTSGQEAFVARAALAEVAQHTLDLQYYVVAEDATATVLLYQTLRAAQRGVRVRLLIDDLDVGDRDSHLAILASHPNVQLRVFNPFAWRGSPSLAWALDYLTGGARLNRRMHNKLWIADNAAVVIGGRNLGDAYFNADSLNNFADLDVLLVGPLVAEASRSFDEYWNSEWAVPIQAFAGPVPGPEHSEQLVSQLATRAATFHDSDYVRELLATGFGPQVRSGKIELIAAPATVLHEAPIERMTSGADQLGSVLPRLQRIINAAQHEVVLISPYFVPNERGIDTLCSLAQRGVRVRVLTNSMASTDVPAVHAAYARYRPRLLACGVALHEFQPVVPRSGGSRRLLSSSISLHAKAIMVDRKTILIGSMNLDPRSRLTNTEVAVLIESAALGSELAQWFDEAASLDRSYRPALTNPGNPDAPLTWTGCEDDRLQHYAGEPGAGWWRRFASGLLGVLVPEDLL